MKIDSYNVNTSSKQDSISFTSLSAARTVTTVKIPAATEEQAPAVKLDLSDVAKKLSEKARAAMSETLEGSINAAKNSTSAAALTSGNMPKSAEDLKLQLLDMLMYSLTGKRMNFKPLELPQNNAPSFNPIRASQSIVHNPGNGERTAQVEQWTFEEFNYESESFSYQAKGVVNTADGQSIAIDINLSMSREVMSYTSVSLEVMQMCDPLVINYGGTAASLTDEKFDFDLTMDGVNEQISFAGEGSGFLMLDTYGDRSVKDGSQLFGPKSGDGFSELSVHDGDGNNWIDENDDVFSKLLVWSKDKDGNDQFFTLKELGIGAIYLGSQDTNMTMAGSNGNVNGAMRSTSFFLKEDGGAGTLHHIDLVT